MKNTNQIIPGAVFLLYLAINIYIAVFNWDIITTVLNFEFGFVTIAILPFIVLFILSLIIILIFWFILYKRDLNNHIRQLQSDVLIIELQKDIEIEKLKAQEIIQKQKDSAERSIVADNPLTSPNQNEPLEQDTSLD